MSPIRQARDPGQCPLRGHWRECVARPATGGGHHLATRGESPRRGAAQRHVNGAVLTAAKHWELLERANATLLWWALRRAAAGAKNRWVSLRHLREPEREASSCVDLRFWLGGEDGLG